MTTIYAHSSKPMLELLAGFPAFIALRNAGCAIEASVVEDVRKVDADDRPWFADVWTLLVMWQSGSLTSEVEVDRDLRLLNTKVAEILALHLEQMLDQSGLRPK